MTQKILYYFKRNLHIREFILQKRAKNNMVMIKALTLI